MDIGSAVGRAMGVDERAMAAVRDPRAAGDVLSPVEVLAIELAEAMTSVPADVPDALRDELLTHLSKAQYVELVASIAWENHRARINRALGVQANGFSDGAFCVLPEHR